MKILRVSFFLSVFSFILSACQSTPAYATTRALMENLPASGNSFYVNTASSYTVIGSSVQASTATLTVGLNGTKNIAANCIKFPSGFQCAPGISTTSAVTAVTSGYGITVNGTTNARVVNWLNTGIASMTVTASTITTLSAPAIDSVATLRFSNSTQQTTAASTGPFIAFTDWAAYTPTFVGLGTVSQTSVFWKQVGNTISIRGYTKCGTVTAAATTITLPNSTAINTSSIPGGSKAQLGFGYQLFSAAGPTNLALGLAAGPLIIFSDGSDTTHIFVAYQDTSSVYSKGLGNAMFLSNDGFSFEFSYPL